MEQSTTLPSKLVVCFILLPTSIGQTRIPAGRKVTPDSEAAHCCNGLNKNANPTPGEVLLVH